MKIRQMKENVKLGDTFNMEPARSNYDLPASKIVVLCSAWPQQLAKSKYSFSSFLQLVDRVLYPKS